MFKNIDVHVDKFDEFGTYLCHKGVCFQDSVPKDQYKLIYSVYVIIFEVL